MFPPSGEQIKSPEFKRGLLDEIKYVGYAFISKFSFPLNAIWFKNRFKIKSIITVLDSYLVIKNARGIR